MSDIVYDGKVYLRLSVDVSQPNMFAPPLVKQGDSNTRALVITLTDNSEPIAIPDDATVWLNCRNTADNEKRASVECEINADGTVTGIVPTVVMEAAGIIECDVSVITLSESNETELLKSTLFCLSCERAANKEGTTTEAEDSILTGIASGEITIPAAKGDPGPPGPPGPEGSSVTIINAETVPESASWGDEIPYTYVGEYGDVAFWNGELWYLSAINEYGAQKTYAWERLLSLFDLEELENAINAKMSLAPLNPTAEQIAALPVGQVYGDTANHKGTIKGGQSFYDSAYIDENYRRTFIDNEYNPPYRVPSSVNDFQIGDMWVNTGQMRSFTLVSISTSDNFKHYNWKPENIVFIKIPNQPQVGDEFPSRTIDSEKWIYNPTWFIGDIVFNEKQGTGVSERLWTLRNLIVSVTSLITCSYKWQEISIPENTYTKNEIDTMIGDIESLLSEV